MACCGTIKENDRSLRSIIQKGLRGGVVSFVLDRDNRTAIAQQLFLRLAGLALGRTPADPADVPLLANRLLRRKISARLYVVSPRLAGMTFKGIKLLAPVKSPVQCTDDVCKLSS